MAATLIPPAAALQVVVDQIGGALVQALAVDLQVLHHPLHIVARLVERDALDPVDGVDLGLARVAIGVDPLLHIAGAGIVSGKGQDIGPAPFLQQIVASSAWP